MRILELNHVALHVEDLDSSIRFYGELLGLQQIQRPNFNFAGAWFRLGVTQELHLISERRHPVYSHSRGTHFALGVDNIRQWDRRLSSEDVERTELRTRPDGAHQIFLCDPDGHWIELVSYEQLPSDE